MKYDRDAFNPFITDGAHRPKPLPNAKQIDDRQALNDMAAFGHMLEPVWGYCKIDETDVQHWTQFFLQVREGTGMAVAYGRGAFRFALCQHEKVLGPSDRPNHIRGWHPGHCKHCGLDMTVDSSD